MVNFYKAPPYISIIITFFLHVVVSHNIAAQSFEWVKSAGGDTKASPIYPGKIHVDAEGNTFVTGAFYQYATFEDITLATSTETSYADFFIAKYNSEGKLVWIKRDGSSGSEFANSIAVDTHGNIFVSGFFSKIFDRFSCAIGGVVLDTRDNEHEYFIAKYDSDGNLLWVRQSQHSGHITDPASRMTLDSEGNVVFQGSFKGEILFGDISLKNDGKSYSLFTVKLSANGDPLWIASQFSHINYAGPPDLIYGKGLKVDKTGDIYYTGMFTGTINTPEGPVNSKDSDMFFVKLNPQGQQVWFKTFGNNSYVTDLSIDSKGNPYVLFTSSQPIIGTVSNQKGWGSFVAKFDQDGNAYQITSIAENVHCAAMAISENDKVFAIGHYSPQARIDCVVLQSKSNNNDAIIISQDASGNLQWVKEVRGSFGMWALDIKLDMSNNAYGLGYFRGDITFDDFEVLNIGATNASEMGLLTSNMFITKVNNINTHAPPTSQVITCDILQAVSVDKDVILNATTEREAFPMVYSWDLGNGDVKTTSTPNLRYTYKELGTYKVTVTITDAFGCSTTCSSTLIVPDLVVAEPKPEVAGPKPEIMIPNVFTPNGDGKNDVFKIVSYTEDTPIQIKIFNRWGKQIALIEDGTKGWDGAGCPAGLYYYIISAMGEERKGWVELIK